jgi:hypothetical protein
MEGPVSGGVVLIEALHVAVVTEVGVVIDRHSMRW